MMIPALVLCCIALAPYHAWADGDGNGNGQGRDHGQDHGKDHGSDHGHGDDHDERKVQVSERRSMRFGTVASSVDGAGAVALSPSGGLSATGFAAILDDRSRVGQFEINGPDNATVFVTLPTTVTFSSGAGTTTLTNFTSFPPAGMVTLDRRGKLTLTVGATMNIPAGQSAGEYTGTYTIYVDLQ